MNSISKTLGTVCLIVTPSPFLMDERVFMSLGILKVGSSLIAQNVHVETLDLSGVQNFLEVVEDYIASHPDVRFFGITATTPQMPDAHLIAQTIRRVQPTARTILGGPHITLVNAACKKEKKLNRAFEGRSAKDMRRMEEVFDVLVAGDGEDAIFLALEDNPPKLIDADERKSPLFLTDERFTDSPWPARNLVDVGSYKYSIDGVPALSLIGQLGCPYECGFCGGRYSPMLRALRIRTAENIVEEMVHLYTTYGTRGFMFYDDELNVNTGIVHLMNLISQAQKDLRVEWRLRGFVKSQLLTDNQAEAMYKAGFRWILVGFESGSEEILTAINKKATRAENTRCMDIARRHGLKVKALMSLGHPGESPHTIRETEEWLLEVRPDDFDATVITCFPGTPYYDLAVPHENRKGIWTYTFEKTGARLHQEELDYLKTADYYKGDPNGGYVSHVFTDFLTPEELVRLRDAVEKRVREELTIPFYQSAAAVRYEHSMGQLPPSILRTSA